MSIDNWSTVHNEPVVCSSATTSDGDACLVHHFDTSGSPHTSDYLEQISMQNLKSAEKKFHCRIRNFVMDNASKMTKIRKEMEKMLMLLHMVAQLTF